MAINPEIEKIVMNHFKFTAKCTESYVEDDTEYWTEGQVYDCHTADFKTIYIETNIGTEGAVGDGYSIEHFEDKFTVDKGIDSPIPFEFLSYESRDRIHREQWKLCVIEDIRSRLSERDDYGLGTDALDCAATAYCFDGEYDCNLDYWANIDNLIENYGTKCDGGRDALEEYLNGLKINGDLTYEDVSSILSDYDRWLEECPDEDAYVYDSNNYSRTNDDDFDN